MKEKRNFSKTIKFDLSSGLVVFFVALPLCLGISMTSTAYKAQGDLEAFDGIPLPGIIAGIVGGIIVGAFSGSRFGVSGPAAGLITIVSAAIVSFGGFQDGGFEKFALAVALGGVIQFVFGLIRAGFVAYYIPFSVIKGMLAGIGVTIFLKELPHFIGYDKDAEGDWTFHQMDGETTFSELEIMWDKSHLGAAIIAVISLAILIFWGMKFIKNHKILSLIPGPLLAILASVGLAAVFVNYPELSLASETIGESSSHLVNVPTPSNFNEFKGMLYFPDFSAIGDPAVWGVAVTIALVASIESLLCVEATDKMDPNKGRTPMNRELRAQGIGNIISGMLGGLPITQVIVRSTANIGAGAKTKNSAIIHGFFLLIFIVAIPGVLNLIPRATLAAILLLIGWKLASPKSIVQMIKSGWTQYIPFFTVIIVMLTTDLLIGVGAGLVVAFTIILYRNFRMSFFLKDDSHDGKIHLNLSQHTTFLNKASIMKTLDGIEDGKEVVIDLSETISIDYDVQEAINDFIEGAEDRDQTVEVIHPEKLKVKGQMSH